MFAVVLYAENIPMLRSLCTEEFKYYFMHRKKKLINVIPKIQAFLAKICKAVVLTYGKLPVQNSGSSHSLFSVGLHAVPALTNWQLSQHDPTSHTAFGNSSQVLALQH